MIYPFITNQKWIKVTILKEACYHLGKKDFRSLDLDLIKKRSKTLMNGKNKITNNYTIVNVGKLLNE